MDVSWDPRIALIVGAVGLVLIGFGVALDLAESVIGCHEIGEEADDLDDPVKGGS